MGHMFAHEAIVFPIFQTQNIHPWRVSQVVYNENTDGMLVVCRRASQPGVSGYSYLCLIFN